MRISKAVGVRNVFITLITLRSRTQIEHYNRRFLTKSNMTLHLNLFIIIAFRIHIFAVYSQVELFLYEHGLGHGLSYFSFHSVFDTTFNYPQTYSSFNHTQRTAYLCSYIMIFFFGHSSDVRIYPSSFLQLHSFVTRSMSFHSIVLLYIRLRIYCVASFAEVTCYCQVRMSAAKRRWSDWQHTQQVSVYFYLFLMRFNLSLCVSIQRPERHTENMYSHFY